MVRATLHPPSGVGRQGGAGELGALAHADEAVAGFVAGAVGAPCGGRSCVVDHGHLDPLPRACVDAHAAASAGRVPGRVREAFLHGAIGGELRQGPDGRRSRKPLDGAEEFECDIRTRCSGGLDERRDACQRLDAHGAGRRGRGIRIAQQHHEIAQVAQHRRALLANLRDGTLRAFGVDVDLAADRARHHRDPGEVVGGDVVQLARHRGALAGDRDLEQRITLAAQCEQGGGVRRARVATRRQHGRDDDGYPDGADRLGETITDGRPRRVAGERFARDHRCRHERAAEHERGRRTARLRRVAQGEGGDQHGGHARADGLADADQREHAGGHGDQRRARCPTAQGEHRRLSRQHSRREPPHRLPEAGRPLHVGEARVVQGRDRDQQADRDEPARERHDVARAPGAPDRLL
jgi:hypothetical protein